MSEQPSTEPTFFETSQAFRGWFEQHHATAAELLVGFHKTGSGVASITWPESVDQALCFGWIDGVRRSLDPDRYTIRFTPRRPGSHWSAVNVAKMTRLSADGLVTEAGLRAFEQRTPENTARASYERPTPAELDPQEDAAFRADPVAWAWFDGQAAWYRRAALHWVVSAKRAETRARRLALLIECSREGRPIGQLAR